jgi:hypothetical protein
VPGWQEIQKEELLMPEPLENVPGMHAIQKNELLTPEPLE